MQDQEEEAGALLWAHGEMMFRVQGAARGPEGIVHIRRPFALSGSGDGADIMLRGQGVSDPHVYLHLDYRGVYAVDLATRAGTRFSGSDRSAGWLLPGHWLEVAEHRIELLRTQIDGVVHDPSPCDTDLLADTSQTTLIGFALEPQRSGGFPWVLNSELVFAGRSDACGIVVKDRTVARAHATLLRTVTAAYVIDLCGHHTWIDDQPVHGASVVHDGQILTLGSTQFRVSVKPATGSEPPHNMPTTFVPSGGVNPDTLFGADLPSPLEAMPAESRSATLAWMMGTVQGSQGEALRQQGEFLRTLTLLLNQIQQDNASMFAAHLARIENADRELASLRAELNRRGADPATPPSVALPPPPRVAPLPVKPLRIPRTTPEATRSRTSTTWLLQRVSLLESQNRSAWREFLGRLALLPRRAT